MGGAYLFQLQTNHSQNKYKDTCMLELVSDVDLAVEIAVGRKSYAT